MDCGFLNDYAYLSTRPNYIGLAHELIHADRDLSGAGKNRDDAEYKGFDAKNSLYDTNGKTRAASQATPEENATVGLYYTSEGDITENMIRAEHGLRLRGAYNRAKKR